MLKKNGAAPNRNRIVPDAESPRITYTFYTMENCDNQKRYDVCSVIDSSPKKLAQVTRVESVLFGTAVEIPVYPKRN